MRRETLIAYYSLSGNSRRLAEELARALDADLEEIREERPRRGIRGRLRTLLDVLFRREPRLALPTHDPRGYGTLVIGGPVWAGRLASPVRSFARRHAAGPRRIAVFCTAGGRGTERAFGELERFMGRIPSAALAVIARDAPSERHREALARFVAALHPTRPPLVAPTVASAAPLPV